MLLVQCKKTDIVICVEQGVTDLQYGPADATATLSSFRKFNKTFKVIKTFDNLLIFINPGAGHYMICCASSSMNVAALCCSGHYQLRQLRPDVRSLTGNVAKTLVQAFITCRLDYCILLLYGVSNNQSVQNAAACLVTGSRRCEHINVFNASKSQCLIVNSKYVLISNPSFHLSGVSLPYTDCYKYLGQLINSSLYRMMLIL